jgi:hypothetical protein
MKHILASLYLVFALTLTASAQTDTIMIRKNFFGTTYRKDEKLLNTNRLEKILNKDKDAARELQKSKAPAAAGFAFGFAGGLIIGYDLGRALGSGDAVNPAMLGVGAGLIGLSIPFNISAQKHIRESVRMYNDHHGKTALKERER